MWISVAIRESNMEASRISAQIPESVALFLSSSSLPASRHCDFHFEIETQTQLQCCHSPPQHTLFMLLVGGRGKSCRLNIPTQGKRTEQHSSEMQCWLWREQWKCSWLSDGNATTTRVNGLSAVWWSNDSIHPEKGRTGAGYGTGW